MSNTAKLVRLVSAMLGVALVISVSALCYGLFRERGMLVVKAFIALFLLLVVMYGLIGFVRSGDLEDVKDLEEE